VWEVWAAGREGAGQKSGGIKREEELPFSKAGCSFGLATV